MSSEKRHYLRKYFYTTVNVSLPDEKVCSAKSIDLSLGGICLLVTDKTFPDTGICSLRFDLLLYGRIRTITAAAKVTHSVCSREGFRVGLQFLKLDSGCSACIEAFMLG